LIGSFLVDDWLVQPLANQAGTHRVKTRSVTFENIGGSPIVTPLFSKASSFDVVARTW